MTVAPAPSEFDPSVDRATQHLRRLRLAGTLAAAVARASLLPTTTADRRQRLQVCTAARILTALGVVVRAVPPRQGWPRPGQARLVTAAGAGRLADLAVLTALPRSMPGWNDVCARALTGRLGGRPSAGTAADAVGWTVALRYRTDAGPLEHPPASLAELLAARGLVVEVHLLPAEVGTPPIPRPRAAP